MFPFGYLIVFGFLAGLTVFCFVWGVWEYKKPSDAGPLFMDLDRTINKRSKEHGRRAYTTVDSEPSVHSRKGLKEVELSQPIEWSSKMDGLIKERFEARARIWMQEAETIRVRGDVRIPRGEVIPYNMIVEGNLTSDGDVTFQGGLHVKGRAVIGARNYLRKSIVCQKELVILEDVIVHNCIDCEGPVFIRKGVRVGVGVDGGGVASASTICVEKAEGPLKIYSKKGVRIVESLREVIPEDLRPGCFEQAIEVEAT